MSTPLDELERKIVRRVRRSRRKEVTEILGSITQIIQWIRGDGPAPTDRFQHVHPQLSQLVQKGSLEDANSLHQRLELIDQYQISDPNLILNSLVSEFTVKYDKQFSIRKARVLSELFRDPTMHKYKLATQLDVSARTLKKELNELAHNHSFRIYGSLDPHKFKLVQQFVLFHAKSIHHAQDLRDFIQRQKGFLHSFHLDRAHRRGFLSYRYPDQPEGHKMFERRVRWLQDEFFESTFITRVEGHYYNISFSYYNPVLNAFELEADIVSEVMLGFVKEHQGTIPSPKGFTFTEPRPFDRTDYLLALTLYATGEAKNVNYRRKLLKRYEIDLSLKTIWRREQELRRAKVAYPFIDFQIPSLDEYTLLAVWSKPDVRKTIITLFTVLPYSSIYTTNSGFLIFIQCPSFSSSITSQLIRTLHNEEGVIDIELFRYQKEEHKPANYDIVNRWNPKLQTWTLNEGDI